MNGFRVRSTWNRKSAQSVRVPTGTHRENRGTMPERKNQKRDTPDKSDKSEFEKFEDFTKRLVRVPARRGTPIGPSEDDEGHEGQREGQ